MDGGELDLSAESNEIAKRHLFKGRTKITFTIISVLILGISLSKTFSANILINTGKNVEFGSGVSQVTSCSNGRSIQLIPKSTYVNFGGISSLKLSAIQISDVPASCSNSMLRIRVYPISSDVPLDLGKKDLGNDPPTSDGMFNEIIVSNRAGGISLASSDPSVGFDSVNNVYDHSGATLLLNYRTFLNNSIYNLKYGSGTYLSCKVTDQINYSDLADSKNIYKFTIESFPIDSSISRWYAISNQAYC